LLDIIKILLFPFIPIYSIVVRLRNTFFDKGIYKIEKANAKVISVGNITVGGSGKTPTVIYITKLLKEKGISVGILSRGYMRKTKGYLFVSDGRKIFRGVEDCGDEIYLASQECKVPAAVSERRVEGARKFLSDVKLQAIVLDDAFQHRWIYRDIDILLFDQRFLLMTNKMEQNLLPSGQMREPFNAIKRADLVIVNRKFSEKKPIPEQLKKFFENVTLFHAFYKATEIVDVKTNETFTLPEFQGQKSLVVSGIARPFSFIKILEENNIDVRHRLLFPDHKYYTEKEVQKIRKEFYETNSYSVLTTQKDAVKLSQYSRELDDIDIYFLKIEIDFEEKEKFNKEILNIFTQ
jgi:tetraacyldisaccharide 4'-kinase